MYQTLSIQLQLQALRQGFVFTSMIEPSVQPCFTIIVSPCGLCIRLYYTNHSPHCISVFFLTGGRQQHSHKTLISKELPNTLSRRLQNMKHRGWYYSHQFKSTCPKVKKCKSAISAGGWKTPANVQAALMKMHCKKHSTLSALMWSVDSVCYVITIILTQVILPAL